MPLQVRITKTARVPAPPERIWTALVDPDIMITPGVTTTPVSATGDVGEVGATTVTDAWFEWGRVTSTTVIAESVPRQRLRCAVVEDPGVESETLWELAPSDGATLLTLTVEAELPTIRAVASRTILHANVEATLRAVAEHVAPGSGAEPFVADTFVLRRSRCIMLGGIVLVLVWWQIGSTLGMICSALVIVMGLQHEPVIARRVNRRIDLVAWYVLAGATFMMITMIAASLAQPIFD